MVVVVVAIIAAAAAAATEAANPGLSRGSIYLHFTSLSIIMWKYVLSLQSNPACKWLSFLQFHVYDNHTNSLSTNCHAISQLSNAPCRHALDRCGEGRQNGQLGYYQDANNDCHNRKVDSSFMKNGYWCRSTHISSSSLNAAYMRTEPVFQY